VLQSTSGGHGTLDLGTFGTTNEATLISNFPFEHPVKVRQLDRRGLKDLLGTFEEAWATQHGERLESVDFYERYRSGDIDSIFGMAWASYYEAYHRLKEADEHLVQALLPG
jgi:hypothetical protein